MTGTPKGSSRMIKKTIKYIFKKLGFEVRRTPDNNFSKNTEIIVDNYQDDFLRLKNEYSKYPIKKIHFGCGPRVLKGWINIDLSYEPYEKYLQSYGETFYPQSIRGDRSDLYAFDITKCGLPLPDDSVDIIFHEDFIEHLNQRDQVLFLAETKRVLKKGGIHRVNTPNILSSMRDHSEFQKGFSGVCIDEWNRWEHINVLTPNLLTELALMVGYLSVIFNSRDKSFGCEYLPLEYRPGFDRSEDGNIFADLIK